MVSKRLAKLSVKPEWISSGEEPSSTTFKGVVLWVSESQSNFTTPRYPLTG
jgi:hypothetical protein